MTMLWRAIAAVGGTAAVMAATAGAAVPAGGVATPPSPAHELLRPVLAEPPPVPIPEVAPRGRPVPMPHAQPRGPRPVPMPTLEPRTGIELPRR